MTTEPAVHVFSRVNELHHAAAEYTTWLAAERIAAAGAFTLLLSGGTTPQGYYHLLTQEPYRSRIAWEHVIILWGDERYVPHTHPDSTYRMVMETLLHHVPVVPAHIHPVPTHLADIRAAVQAYHQEVQDVLQTHGGYFDLAVQGMGPDGHTASLFPHHPALNTPDDVLVVAVEDAPKPPPRRITLTIAALNRARHVLFLVTGADKAATLRAVLSGDDTTHRLPAQLVRPPHGTVTWMVDTPAYCALPPHGSQP